MKSYYGRLLGAFFGLIMTGSVFGAIIGCFIGSFFDNGRLQWQRFAMPGMGGVQRTRQVFFRTTFEVMGHLAKADGQVTQHEIIFAREVMRQMRLTEVMKADAIRCFNRGKRSDYDLQAALIELRRSCGYYQALLRMFVEIQQRFVQTDGGVAPAQQRILGDIFRVLGVAQSSYSYQRSYQQQATGVSKEAQLVQAYALLGVKPPATQSTVKSAYRKQMSQHHPDKMMAKGLPEEMIRLATEKTQDIQSAYDLICRHGSAMS